VNRVTKVSLGVIGIGISLVCLGEMLAHYGAGGTGSGGNWPHPPSLPAALAGIARRPVSDSLTITLRPHSGGVDTVYTADVTIVNASAESVRDVAIRCDALGDDGVATGQVTVLLGRLFAPHASTTETDLPLPFIHRPTSVRCLIADFRIDP
jgi:hypothetical protein